ncbi:right-handed parallel beta-helix repeat-containing protein [Nannocystis pusilla]|uniref:right-handed parallel beta-helix repeat-containing protein n=1 Tax=Nannocystis pusilla TaxID=889268 RepID=UPI003B79CB32
MVIENNIIRGGLGHGITLGRVVTEYIHDNYGTAFEPNGWFSMGDDPDCPSVTSELPASSTGAGATATTLTASTQADVVIRGNRIDQMGASGIAVPGFWSDELTLDVEGQRMFRSPNLVIEDNLIEANCRRPYHGVPGLGYGEMVAFGGVVLADTDNLRIHDNRIVGNGVDHRYPICGIYVFHGEDLAIENNEVRDNGRRIGGAAFAGNRAGIALRFVGRLATSYGSGSYESEPDSLRPAARVRGNVVDQPAGRALELYGIGPMLIEGNAFSSGGLTHPVPPERAHCIEIHNIGLSAEIAVLGYVPGNLGYLPAPPLPADEPPTSQDTVDGRILFTGNQVHFRPVAGASTNIYRAVSLQSYDDVAVLDNQFVTTFPSGVGNMMCDTVVTAWSTRTNHNRWEDPIGALPNGSFQTDISASTLGVMNFTKLNEASRCIHVQVSMLTDPIANNGDGTNLTYTECDPVPGFVELLAPHALSGPAPTPLSRKSRPWQTTTSPATSSAPRIATPACACSRVGPCSTRTSARARCSTTRTSARSPST